MPKETKYSSDITFAPNKWLNDREIEWAYQEIAKNSKKKHIFISVFDFLLAEARNDPLADARLFSELARTDVELIFIPINNFETHWSLIVYETKENKFYHLDSSRQKLNEQYIQKFIKHYCQHKNASFEDVNERPLQPNADDCGVYLLAFTNLLAENPELLRIGIPEIDSEKERGYWRGKVEEVVDNKSKKMSETKSCWQEIHPDFTPELQKEWEELRFSREECKEWINIGLKASDANFCAWLIDIKRLDVEWVLNHENKEWLREEYANWQYQESLLRRINFWKNNYEQSFSITNQLLEKVKDLEQAKSELQSLQLQYADLPKTKWFMSNSKKQSLVDNSNHFQRKIEEYSIKTEQLTNERDILIETISELQEEFNIREGKKLNWEAIDQIKNFDHRNLTSEQELLVEQLIFNEELRRRYKEFGLCEECSQPNTGYSWCQSCNSKHFKKDFGKWTSGNQEIDKFIQKCQLGATNRIEILEWIPYEQFASIEYLAEGGFGKVYKSEWTNGSIIGWNNECSKWTKGGPGSIVLKSLHNSRKITTEFLQEVIHNKLIGTTVPCYGISQDPKTGNYLMVMHYSRAGDLKKYLQNKYNKLSFKDKTIQLAYIAACLNGIHSNKLMHQDLHSGNILVYEEESGIYGLITDLGLCRPANEVDRSKVYGVLPYVAPEVLRGQPYTQASDVYSFGIIAYEILTGKSPYYDLAHDDFLALKICQGLRPSLNKIAAPKLLKNLIEKCWDVDPTKRPKASEIAEKFGYWTVKTSVANWTYSIRENTDFYQQYREIEKSEDDEFIESLFSPSEEIPTSTITHPQAIYTSRLLNFKNLSESHEQLYSENLTFDFTKLSVGGEENSQIWTNTKFTEELVKEWINLGFNHSQSQEWINIGLSPTDFALAAYLRDHKHLTAEEVLNHHNYQQLKAEYQNYQEQLQFQQEQPPKGSL